MEMAQVGVRTRARAALAMGAESSAARTSKRRKINNSNQDLSFSAASSAFVQLPSTTPLQEEEERHSGESSNELPASCCSSNGSTGLDEERIKLSDLEVDSAQTCKCDDEIESSPLPLSSRREMSSSSEVRANSPELESVEANSRRIKSTAQKMPSEMELEEFFATAEKEIQKRFEAKYNYDIVRDVPLEGRYEWVQLKP